MTLGSGFFSRLGQGRVEAFERSVRMHVEKHFAVVVDSLGPDATTALLRQALDGAEQHGFITQRDAARWVNLMFHYGPNFPQSDPFVWAQDILSDSLAAKIDRLVSVALTHGRP